MTRQRYLSLGLALVLGCAAASSLRAQQFTFQTFSIQQNTGALSVSGLNDFGTTSGDFVDVHGNTEGWVRDPLGNISTVINPRNTPPPGKPHYTRANGINDIGVIGGDYYDTAAGAYMGYFAFAGKFTPYTVPGQPSGTQTSVDGLANFGSFCGYVGNQAFVTINGKATVFSVDSSSFTFCENVNDLGWAVGGYTDNNTGISHGWIRNPFNGQITTYDAPGASSTTGTPENNPCKLDVNGGTAVYGINDLGELAGHFWDTSFNEHGFVLSPNGNFTQIDVPGAISTSLGNVNNIGQVDGHYLDSHCNNLGYIATPNHE